MKLNRDNFGQLLTPIHKKVFFNAYDEVPEQFSKVFSIGGMSKKEETFPHMGAFGLWEENTEGNTINEDQMSQGDTATFTARRFDKGYEVTWELVQDDLYNVMKGIGKGGSAKALGRGLRATIENDAASVLNNGFANTGYDGVSLFSNSHPLADSASTVDNLASGALSDATLKDAMILMRDQRDEANIRIMAMPKQLIVPPELEYIAKAIVNSSGPSGELSNDTNTVPKLEIVCMDYLSSATAWFLRDKNIENLMFLWREKAIFDSQKIQKTVDQFMFGYARWDNGYTDFRGLVGSTGV
ncbi:Mu-like prophage major head subunit gpT family protein [Anaerosolibacter sp.]|uniref:phage major capsid protein n=1 Tax=Anaerosolibacter sp. TaxID=1872527 RepID=UPI0039EFBA61